MSLLAVILLTILPTDYLDGVYPARQYDLRSTAVLSEPVVFPYRWLPVGFHSPDGTDWMVRDTTAMQRSAVIAGLDWWADATGSRFDWQEIPFAGTDAFQPGVLTLAIHGMGYTSGSPRIEYRDNAVWRLYGGWLGIDDDYAGNPWSLTLLGVHEGGHVLGFADQYNQTRPGGKPNSVMNNLWSQTGLTGFDLELVTTTYGYGLLQSAVPEPAALALCLTAIGLFAWRSQSFGLDHEPNGNEIEAAQR